MQINVSVDDTRLLRRLSHWQRRLAYSVVNAINETAKMVQEAEQGMVRQQFTVRKTAFVQRQIAVIKPFASVKRGLLYAEVAVGKKDRLFLSTFEKGGQRPKTGPGRRVAKPMPGTPARPTWQHSVPRAYYFQNLNLIEKVGKEGKPSKRRKRSMSLSAYTTRSGKKQWKGAHRTFLLEQTAKAPLGGVFQRVGPGRDDIRMVYSFARNQQIKQRMVWLRTAKKVARRQLPLRIKANILSEIARG